MNVYQQSSVDASVSESTTGSCFASLFVTFCELKPSARKLLDVLVSDILS